MKTNAPKTISELLQRCDNIAGKSIADLAEELNLNIPQNLLHAKGWVGQLIEAYLGASASSKAMPDFTDLAIELKTIPIDLNRKPLETTYVCTLQTNKTAIEWRDSWVYQKLRHVLWVPVLASANISLTQRTIVKPILWQMDDNNEAILRCDWEELMEMMQLGYGKSVSAKFGTYLHIRPKAANNNVLIDYIDKDGENTKIVPKGFYLRTSFTSQILQNNLLQQKTALAAQYMENDHSQ